MTRTGYRQGNWIRINGDGSATILSSNGDRIEIDEADIERVCMHTWSTYPSPKGKTKYAKARISDALTVRLHTFLLYGAELTNGRTVDHIDRDGLNNRRSNLRSASALENSRNHSLRSDNVSGFKGVSRHSKNDCWVANINPTPGVQKYLGSYKAPETAARAYDIAAIKYFGQFAVLNFPKENYL